MYLDRRQFLTTVVGAGASIALGACKVDGLEAEPAQGAFDFIFFTDTHIQPELDATHGCEICFRKIAGLKGDFAVMGGDHVFDVLGVAGARARLVYDLSQKTEQLLQTKVYHTIGNHDVFGVLTKSGVAPNEPAYGKRMYEERIGRKTYYSFDHKGYHFVVLDSIQPTEDRMWEARVDQVQLNWLAADLEQAGATVPVVGITHVPLVTAFANYVERSTQSQRYNTLTVDNAAQVLKLFQGHNVLAVLQGHTHINEIVSYKNTQYISGGAVCGNWWHGPRMGVPEGFTVVSLADGKISTRYETYGFKSVDLREKF
jgi:3',5'-cyclic-AMP phosphodiesterase